MHRTKDVYNHAKKGAIHIETPLDIFKMQMLRKKSFYKKCLRLDPIFTRLKTFFLQDFYSCDLISGDVIESPHSILRKKSRESKTPDFISSDILF